MLVSITLAAVLAAGEPGASTAPTAAPVSSAPTAATPVAPLPVLTFDDALAQARQHSVELEVAAAKLAQAKSLSGKAWSYYLPHLSAGASISRNSDEAVLDLPTAFAIRNIGVPSSVYDPSNPAGPTPYDPTKPFSKTNLPGAPTTNVLVP